MHFRQYRAWAVFVVATNAIFFGACGTSPSRHDRPLVEAREGATQAGLATYYASKFQGRKTASGERYDADKLTAAHRTLPFGSLVRVTRVDRDGRQVADPLVVRVNDRGPFAKGRIIDLSYAAARRLDMIRDGVVRVRIQVVKLPRRRDSQ